MNCRIGSGSGYWGDMTDPAAELAEKGDIGYLCFDLLAELTVSILSRSRLRDPSRGHIPDVEMILRDVLPAARRNDVKLITNGGGANPSSGADLAARVAADMGHDDVRIGVIEGDEVTDVLAGLRADGWALRNMDTGEADIDGIEDRIVSAHAYTGADGIVEALGEGADIVIGGRLADSAMYAGALMHHFGWDFDRDPELIGAALTIGHVLECGGLCSGLMSSQWRDVKDPWRPGFPLADVAADGTCTIEKVAGTGGLINQWTVKEHLLYEVHDPRHYLLPDGEVDMSDIEITEVGEDRVAIRGMSGRPRPDTLKVQIGYEDGFMTSSRAMISWPDALEKADWCEQLVRKRLEYLGVEPLEQRYDRVGVNALAGPVAPAPDYEPNEIDFRMAVRCATREEAETARRAFLLAAIAGPVGTAFINPDPVKKVIGLWPTLIPRSAVTESVRVFTAREVAHAGA